MHKITLVSPFPTGEGGRGMGAESKLKAGLADEKESARPQVHLYGRDCKCRKQSDAGDARGEAPCIK